MGWFPRYNSTGTRLTSEAPGKWQAQWITDDSEIWHDGNHLVVDGAITQHPPLNELAAGGGKWAGTKGGPGVFRSWADIIPGAGSAALNPDGLFAYVDDRQSEVKKLIVEGVGAVRNGPIADVRLSRQLLVWTEGPDQSWGFDLRNHGLLDLRIPGVATFRPIPVDTPEGPWVLNHTHTGIVLRPANDPSRGYRFDNGGNTFYPDGVYRPGVIAAIFTDAAGALNERVFSLSDPRVDLGDVPGATMQLPDRVKQIITILADRFPDLRKGDDDQRRALTLKFAQQIRFELGESWGTKSAGQGRPPSKDAVARMFEGKLYGADVINGSTREPQFPDMEELPGQLFISVNPVNHLDDKLPLPDRVKEIITILADRFPDLRKGDDDQRRALTLKFAQQIRFELGESWGTKRAGEGRPPSKDAIARMFEAKLYGAVVINESTREPQFPGMEELPGQVFMVVEPLNHLGPSPDLAKRVDELERLVATHAATLVALASADEALRRRIEALE
jgi:hypothetical protein